MNVRTTVLGIVLNRTLLSAGMELGQPAFAQAVDPAMPSLPGAWVVKEVRFGGGATGYEVATPSQQQQVRSRMGATYMIASACGQGGPAPKSERELIPHSEFERPTSGRTKRLVSLGLGSRGKGVWQITQMCGNTVRGLYYWVPGTVQILGGHDVNDLFDYEYLFERGSVTGSSGASQPALKDLGQLSGIWVPVGAFPQGCAPSPAWIAASDQAMKIDAKTIERYEWDCAVTAVAPAAANGLRVNARCGYAGTVENVTINMSFADGRLTVREKNANKTYAKCQR